MTQTAQPAREILASSSYDQAMAWIAARLGEALDYAFSREVVHGDIKPSNILISADGNPRLLDFNLARDRSGLGSTHQMKDAGGTIAYMAPERLRALAADADFSDCTGRSSCVTRVAATDRLGPGPSGEDDELDFAAHRADIYSLGMVVLEAITGRTARERWDSRSVALAAGRTLSNRQSMPMLHIALGVPNC